MADEHLKPDKWPSQYVDFLYWASKYFVLDVHSCKCTGEMFEKEQNILAVFSDQYGNPNDVLSGNRIWVPNYPNFSKQVGQRFLSNILKDAKESYSGLDVQVDREDIIDLDKSYTYYIPKADFFGVATASSFGAGIGIVAWNFKDFIYKVKRN